jgi:hypothetical protein
MWVWAVCAKVCGKRKGSAGDVGKLCTPMMLKHCVEAQCEGELVSELSSTCTTADIILKTTPPTCMH